MTDMQPTTQPAETPGTAADPGFDAQRRATELAILDALRAVVDPEIGMNVVELALIRQIVLGTDSTEVKMILTTPFCPYGPAMLEVTRQKAETFLNLPTVVEMGMEMWDFSMMEDPSALDWGMYG
mgnify:CR=1 FL=1